MSFTRWMQNLQSLCHRHSTSGSSRRAGRKGRARFRPRLEVLEGRLAPAVLTVNTPQDETNPNDGSVSLREAIQAINNGSAGSDTDITNENPGPFGSNDTIQFAPGLNGQTITLTQGELDITRSVAINGPGAGRLAVSGNHESGVFNISAATVSLSGLTIANGNSGFEGGGIAANASTLVLTNCALTGNSAFDYGGGVWSQNTVALTVTNCTFTANSALGEAGGGIFNDDGTMAVTNCTFSGNSAAESEGGGISSDGTVAVTGCTFSGNSANYGGGIEENGDMMTVTNCTFSGNSSTGGGDGGAILIDFDPTAMLTVTNSTLTGNSSSDLGGGIAVGSGTVAIANSIIAGNASSASGPDVAGAVASRGYNLIGDPSGGSGFAATDQLGVNPLLGPLQDNGGPTPTMALLSGSPALNAGSNALAVDASGNPLATDQRGFGRIVGPTVDIGAFERQAPALTVPGAQTANQDVALAIPGIRVADVDSNALTVTLAAGHGTLTLASTAGLAVTGNGTAAVTLSGSLADLDDALAGLVYQGNLHYSGSDALNITANDGSLSTQAGVVITVQSVAQEAANLQAQVNALYKAGVLNQGQANALNVKLRLQGNAGDVSRAQSFLNQVEAWLAAGILTPAQADTLLAAGQSLLAGLTA
jgi:CSLREA domain-containing protein